MPRLGKMGNMNQQFAYDDYLGPMMGYPSSTSTQNQSSATSSATQPTAGGNSGLGTLQFETNSNAGQGLPLQTNPFGTAVANAYREHQREYGDFTAALMDSIDSTALADAVPGVVDTAMEVGKGISERNRRRFGYDQTGAERQEMGRENQRTEQSLLSGGFTNARIGDRLRNLNLMSGLAEIGQGIQKRALGQLSTAQGLAQQRTNAYEQAKANYKSGIFGLLGNVGSAMMSKFI